MALWLIRRCRLLLFAHVVGFALSGQFFLLVRRSSVRLLVALSASPVLRVPEFRCYRVPSLTCGFDAAVEAYLSSPYICATCDWLKVIWSYTSAVAAQVVKVKPFWYWSSLKFVGVPVRCSFVAVNIEPPISIRLSNRARPVPASFVGLLDKSPEYIGVLDVSRHRLPSSPLERLYCLTGSVSEGRGYVKCYEEVGGVQYRCYEAIVLVRQAWNLTGGITQ